MIKSVDFLILYELKNREFDNISLIKCELERRGYSVIIQNTILSTNEPKKVDAKVLIIPWLYLDSHIKFASKYVVKLDKLVNLQWEQVFRKAVEYNKNSKRYNFEKLASQAVHISWGPKNRDRLINDCSVYPEKVRIIGDVSFDFLRKEFRNWFMPKSALLKKYNIDENDKVWLFISSFTYVEMIQEKLKKSIELQAVDLNRFQSISIESQKIILNWFETILEEKSDITIIYRPHPSEKLSELVKRLENKYSKFMIIRDFTIPQWIVCSDKILNWYSTSLGQILAAGIKCYLLRPVEIPEEMDLSVLKNDNCHIKCFADFYGIYDETTRPIALEDTYLREYYHFDGEQPNYIGLCNFLEEVYQNDKYAFDFNKHLSQIYPFSWKKAINKNINRIKKQTVVSLNKYKLIRNKGKWLLKLEYNQSLAVHNSITQEEIDRNCLRVLDIISNIK